MERQSALKVKQSMPWAPRAEIAPNTLKAPSGHWVVRSNGSSGCYGGWELQYQTPKAEYVKFRVKARGNNLERREPTYQPLVGGDLRALCD